MSDNIHIEDYRERMINLCPSSDILCPITFNVMVDPVTAADGKKYDRVNIVKWFKDGMKTSPVTGEVMKSTELLPDSTTRSTIEVYREKVLRHYLDERLENNNPNIFAAGASASASAGASVSSKKTNNINLHRSLTAGKLQFISIHLISSQFML